MSLSTYIVTIEDNRGFLRDVEVVANSSDDAVHALGYANNHVYGHGVVVGIKEKVA